MVNRCTIRDLMPIIDFNELCSKIYINDHVNKEDLAITRQYSGDYFVNNYEMVPDDTWNALPYQPMRPRLPGDYYANILIK